MSDCCCGAGNEQCKGHKPPALNGFFDVTTSVLKALVSDVMSWNQTWKSTLGSDYLRVIDVFGKLFLLFIGFLQTNSISAGTCT